MSPLCSDPVPQLIMIFLSLTIYELPYLFILLIRIIIRNILYGSNILLWNASGSKSLKKFHIIAL